MMSVTRFRSNNTAHPGRVTVVTRTPTTTESHKRKQRRYNARSDLITGKSVICGYPLRRSTRKHIMRCTRKTLAARGTKGRCHLHQRTYLRMLEDVASVKDGESNWLRVGPSSIPRAGVGNGLYNKVCSLIQYIYVLYNINMFII